MHISGCFLYINAFSFFIPLKLSLNLEERKGNGLGEDFFLFVYIDLLKV